MRSLLLASLLIALTNAAMSADCSRRDAIRTTVPQVAQHPDDYMNKCVLIDGVMYGHSLFETVAGVYVRSPDTLDDTKSGLRTIIEPGSSGGKDAPQFRTPAMRAGLAEPSHRAH